MLKTKSLAILLSLTVVVMTLAGWGTLKGREAAEKQTPQPTPPEAVSAKDSVTPSPSPTPEPEPVDPLAGISPMFWPENVTASFVSEDGSVELNIDAPITVLGDPTGYYPIYTTENHQWTEEEMLALVEGLTGQTEVFEVKTTRTDLEQHIAALEAELADPDCENPEALEFQIGILEEQLSRCTVETRYDVPAALIADPTLTQSFVVNLPDLLEASFTFDRWLHWEGGNYNSFSYTLHNIESTQLSAIPERSSEDNTENPYTAEEAIAMADALLVELGIDDLALCGEPKLWESDYWNIWELYYTHCMEGVFPSLWTGYESMENCISASSLGLEFLRIHIDSNGVVYLNWKNPNDLLGEQTFCTEPMAFANMLEIAADSFLRAYAEISEGTSEAEGSTLRQYNIDRIELSYLPIPCKENPNQYQLIPVWDFYGNAAYTIDWNYDSNYRLDSNNQYHTRYEGDHSWLTISAIDGTVIARRSMYAY